LFTIFQGYVNQLENTVRWHWNVGDVAIWDNRATQHYAINDYGDQHRVVRRITIDGDVPISIDGRKSVIRKKGASTLEASNQYSLARAQFQCHSTLFI
jgi:taurine dioxygenase